MTECLARSLTCVCACLMGRPRAGPFHIGGVSSDGHKVVTKIIDAGARDDRGGQHGTMLDLP